MEKAESVIGDAENNLWERAGRWRRRLLLAMTIIPSLYASVMVHSLLPAKIGVFVSSSITALFAILFAWIAMGFWSAVAGIAITLCRFDRFHITRDTPPETTLPESVRTALLFPIYNEDAYVVMEGIRTVCQSLKYLGADKNFDVFILSDSTDPEAWVREEDAWHRLCEEENGYGRIFYRHRKINRKGKSGNLADFCRRWGSKYPYMIVFDADSLMSGETLVRMVQTMEMHPDVGILQTAPKSINSRSLIARMQQFSNHLYGPVFAAGLHYWQLGDAQYWGHNAIIRVQPFMEYCHLPTLPGPAPLGGNILSHDFVEAALMRRAGYGVWLAYNLDGSYEENPPTLIDELVRDRRWCQGNLQHSRLLFAQGFFPTHRALFVNGIMTYGSALLWFFFLLISSAQAIIELLTVPDYFPKGPSLFPEWPRFFSNQALGLLAGTATLLFLPKLFTLFLTIAKRGSLKFGGIFAMTASCILELFISSLLAPVRMLFHSLFVVTTLIGFTVRWNTQNRDARGTTWWEAIRFHWWGTLLGLVWGGFMFVFNPGFFLWMSPIVIGLVISIPLSVFTSKVSLGKAAVRLGLFLTPAETDPAPELTTLQDNLETPPPYSPFASLNHKGFVRAVVEPRIYALHVTLAKHSRKNSKEKMSTHLFLVEKALAGGPDCLSRNEKKIILGEPACLTDLHHRVWALDNAKAAEWGIKAF